MLRGVTLPQCERMFCPLANVYPQLFDGARASGLPIDRAPAITSPRTLCIQALVERLWSWRKFLCRLHGAGRTGERFCGGPSRSLDYSPSPVRRVISPQRMNHRSVPEVSRNCLTRLPRGAHVRHTRTRNRHEGPAPARACGRPAPKHPFASIGCSDDTRCSTSHSGSAFLAMAPHCGGATECR